MGDSNARTTAKQARHHEAPASTDLADVVDHGLLHKVARRQTHDFVRPITAKRDDGNYTIITIAKQSGDVVAEDSMGYIHGMLDAQFRVTAVTEFEVTAIVHMHAAKLDLDERQAVLAPSRLPKAGAPVALKGDKGLAKDLGAVPHAYWFDESTGRFGFTVDKGADDGVQAGMLGSLTLPDGDPHNFGPFVIVSVGKDESKAVTVSAYDENEYAFVKEKIIHNHQCTVHAPKHAAAPAHKAPARRLEF